MSRCRYAALLSKLLNDNVQESAMCLVFNAVHQAVGMPQLVQDCGHVLDGKSDELLGRSDPALDCVWQPLAAVTHASELGVAS